MSNHFLSVSNKRTLSDVVKLLLPFLILFAGTATILYYIIFPSVGYMTSDCTDSLRWSYATLTSGKLISEEFFYAAILPFGGNLIFLPFVAMFGYSVKAQICGLCLFAILLISTLFYLAKGLKFNNLAASGLVTVTLLIMSSSPKLREIMWEHIFYYNLGILFFCFGFGLALRILSDVNRNDGFIGVKPYTWVRTAVLMLFSLIAAWDGLQTLVCFTLPLLAGIFVERYLDADEKLLAKKNISTGLLLIFILLFSAVGYLSIDVITNGVTAGYAEAYSAYSDMYTWQTNFLGFMDNWFTLLGVSVVGGTPLVSLVSIVNMIRIVGALLLLVIPVILLCRYKHINNSGIKICLIGHFAVSAFILFASTFGKLGGANWRLVPMLGTSVIVSFAAVIEFIGEKKVMARIGVLLLAFLILLGCVSFVEITSMPKDHGRDNSWHTVADELSKRGLRYGYANFWWAESVTMLSDGKVEIANLYPSQRQPTKYNYQQPADSYDDKDTDRYFLLLTESENTEMNAWLIQQRAKGNISEEFIIESEEYNLRGYIGTKIFVYVFPDNIF